MKKVLLVAVSVLFQAAIGSDVTSLKLSFGLTESECSYELKTSHNAGSVVQPLAGFDPLTDTMSLDNGRIAIHRSNLGLGTTFTIKNLDIFPSCEQVTITKMENSQLERANVILNGHSSEKAWKISKLKLALESITIGTGSSDNDMNDFLIGSIEVLDRDVVSLSINGHGRIAGKTYESGNWIIARDGTIMPFSITNVSHFLGTKGMPRNDQELKEILDAVWDPSDGIGNTAFERWIKPLPGRKADTMYIQKDKLTAALNELVWRIVPSSSQAAKSFIANSNALIRNWTFNGDAEPRTVYGKVEEVIAVVQNLKKLYNSINRLKIGGVIPSWVTSLDVNQTGELESSDILFKLDPSVMQLMPSKDDTQERINTLQNRISELEGQIQRYKIQIENEKARSSKLEQNLQALNQIKEKFDTIEKVKGRQEVEIMATKEENEKLQRKIQDLKQENGQLARKLSLKEEARSSEVQLALLQDQLNRAKIDMAALQEVKEQKISLERDNRDLAIKASALEKELQLIKEQSKTVQDTKAEIFQIKENALQEKMEAANKAAETAKADLSKAQAQIEKLTADRSHYQTFFGMHAVDLAGRSREIHEVIEELGKYQQLYQQGAELTYYARNGTRAQRAITQGAPVQISPYVEKLKGSLEGMLSFNRELYQTFKPFYSGDNVLKLQELKALPGTN